MTLPARAAPPLIVARRMSGAVWWRDVLLTLLMWGLVFALLGRELGLVWHDRLLLAGLLRPSNPGWQVYLERLLPFVSVAAALIAALVLFAVRTLRRRRREVQLPGPPPLDVADQAARAGLDEATLAALRDRKFVTVGVDAGARFRIATDP